MATVFILNKFSTEGFIKGTKKLHVCSLSGRLCGYLETSGRLKLCMNENKNSKALS